MFGNSHRASDLKILHEYGAFILNVPVGAAAVPPSRMKRVENVESFIFRNQLWILIKIEQLSDKTKIFLMSMQQGCPPFITF